MLFKNLPPEKQSETLDFVKFLYQQVGDAQSKQASLNTHPAFGMWKNRKIDAVQYQQNLREEW